MLVKSSPSPTPTYTASTILATEMPSLPPMNTSKVILNNANNSYPIRGKLHCKSTNVMHVMACNTCNIQYVEETSNTMKNRCRGHESSIRTEKDHPVAIHFRSYNHTTDDYSITIMDEEPDKNRTLRLEESSMTLPNTLTPKGLNGRDYK